MTELTVKAARIFEPLIQPARYKGRMRRSRLRQVLVLRPSSLAAF
jgi:hypothetical protein